MVGDAHHRLRARHGLAPTARRETQRHRDDRGQSLRANWFDACVAPTSVPIAQGLRMRAASRHRRFAGHAWRVGATHWVALGHSCQRARSRLGQTNREAVPRDGGRRGAEARHGLAPTFVCARRETQRHRGPATNSACPPSTCQCGPGMSAFVAHGVCAAETGMADPLGRPRSFMPIVLGWDKQIARQCLGMVGDVQCLAPCLIK